MNTPIKSRIHIGLVLCISDQAKFIYHGLNSKAFTQKTLDEEVNKLDEYVEALKKAIKS